jgi:cell division protein FtsI/penicillin-binding protein 2
MCIINKYKAVREAGAMKIDLLVPILILLALPIAAVGDDPSKLEALMQRELPDGAACLFDIVEGEVIALHDAEFWLSEGRPAGSLLKLFTTYALLAAGDTGEAVYLCPPSSVDVPATQSCWYKPGHGNMTLRTALANSCNAYFRQWATASELEPAERFLARLGLLEHEMTLEKSERALALVGLSTEIMPKPAKLVAAAAALFNGGVLYSAERLGSGVRCAPVASFTIDARPLSLIAAGMRECAALGTAAAAQAQVGIEPLLAKTGTSVHIGEDGPDPLRTDGWCLLLFTAKRPPGRRASWRPPS